MMIRLGWLSDIHFDFLDDSARLAFLVGLASRPVDAWLLGGDIGDARSVVPFLRQFHDQVPVPIYFVLGNHDFYYSSIAVVREQVGECVRYCSRLAWLTGSGAQFLSPTLALVGDDSWADARFGDAERS